MMAYGGLRQVSYTYVQMNWNFLPPTFSRPFGTNSLSLILKVASEGFC